MDTNSGKLAITAFFTTAVIFFVTGFIIGERYASKGYGNTYITDTRVVKDTVTKIVERQPIYISTAAKVEYVRDTILHKDTIYQTKAFIAKLDTAVAKDTLSVQYAFPQHTFSVALRRAADSIQYETKTVYVPVPSDKKPWLEYLGAAAVGFGAGYIVAR